MYILNVVPIAKSAKTLAGHLSYYFKEDVPAGSIVIIPLRNQTVPALVLNTTPLKDSKAELKSQSFGLKKVLSVQMVSFFSKAWMNALNETAKYHARSLGGALASLVPQNILEEMLSLKNSSTKNGQETGKKSANENAHLEYAKNERVSGQLNKAKTNTVFAIQGSLQERISTYKSIIRQNFAQKKSVLVIAPTKEGSVQLFESLKKGLEEYAILLDIENGKASKKAKSKSECADLKLNSEQNHPLLIISTPTFLGQVVYHRNDINSMILDEEYSSAYKTLRRPFIDVRYFILQYCLTSNTLLYLSDSLLRIETLNKIQNRDDIEEHPPFSWRSISTAKAELVDMRTNKEEKEKGQVQNENKFVSEKAEFKILSNKAIELIERTSKESKKMIIFALRKGVSPLTACSDCGTVVTCKKCSATVVLHKSKSGSGNKSDLGSKNNDLMGSYFMCHKCGEKRDAQETCINCGSWNLKALGIGVDSVYEKVQEHIKDGAKIFQIDGENTKTAKQAKKVMAQFYAEPSSILIGTEMMFNYIHEPVDFSAIISLDSLFSLPDYRIGEKIMHILNTLRESTRESLILQTRKPDESVLDFGVKGNLNQYYEHEINMRKLLNQPPFFTHIKLTVMGNKVEISHIMHALQNKVQELGQKNEGSYPLELDVFPAFIHTLKGKSILHGLIRIPSSDWPHAELSAFIQSLPPSVTAKINPDSLL